jgi:class I fructose-bisphosphate aldolase/fructose-bisphosphate aldolase/2-amino-3,7-dideoxy-D-threo-hept-6-ulosonate synthase
MSDTGRAVRLARLIGHPCGRFVSVPMDHAPAHGMLPGLGNITELIARVVAGGPDAVTLHKGLVPGGFTPVAGRTALIVKCSTYSPFHKSFDAPVTSVEEAVALGADAVAIGLILGDERQRELLAGFGRFVAEAHRWGMPVVGHIYPRGPLVPADEHHAVHQVAYAARLGAELGADIVKTLYTGSPESFAEVVAAAPCRVVAAGGMSAPDDETYLRLARDVVASGAAGLAFGRYVWSHPHPAAMVGALRAVVHEGVPPDEALVRLGGGEPARVAA